MRSLLIKLRIGLAHAKYHRYLKKAEIAKEDGDIQRFKKYVYKAEDAWRKIVILINKKYKQNG